MEIKNNTIYTNDLVKEFLRVYYFDKVKTIRIIMNILIAALVVRFFFLDNTTTIDIITFIFSLFGIIELNTNMLPYTNYKRLEKRKDSILNTKIKYLFKEYNFMIDNGKIKINKAIQREGTVPCICMI